MSTSKNCPNDNCLLLQNDFNQDCQVCHLCRAAAASEYAVYIKPKTGIAEVYNFSELASQRLDPDVDRVTIYGLSGENYYCKELVSFQPSTTTEKKALYNLVSSWS